MRIDFQGRGFPLTAPLLDHTERAAERAGRNVARQIDRLHENN
jgi:hypothetical protein